MDIIAEILDTDRIAEEKLIAAEKEKQNIYAQAVEAETQLKAEADEKIAKYRIEKTNETNGLISEKLLEIEQERDNRIARLNSLYDKNHLEWEGCIFERIIG